MAGWPYDTASSFARYPSYYIHDAFGHTGADDVAAGRRGSDVCFRKIPHTGIDISPKQRGDTNAKVVSPVHGTIVRTGHDAEAGAWHIIKHDQYAEWWILGHHSRFTKMVGHVDRGDDIARMGASGGAVGVHTHISVATSLAAALDQINGYINYKNGRSVDSWAASEGLLDPWPLIEREWADEERRLALAEQDRLEKERAAAAAAEAIAKAEAEAKARENNMKTRLVRIKGDILVSNVAEKLLWHVPNTKALPAAYVMADDPEVHDLDEDAAAALFAAYDDGKDVEKIAALRKRLTV